MKLFVLVVVLLTNLLAFSISSDDDYYIYSTDNYNLIYTKNNQQEANFVASNLDNLIQFYNELYNFQFDEKLNISLISNKIQIANAFSTQIPLNETVFYNNGSLYIDYFSSKNWLNTLLLHEISHSYQLNAKVNISKNLKQVFGNNGMPIFISFIPLFTFPNLLLPNFFLEGNAVLNESSFNNGGRLYSGEAKALVNDIMLNSSNLAQIINTTNNFPYGQSAYLIGGYFWQYLANIYGLQNVNKFFIANAKHYINPFLYNKTFYNLFGISLYQALYNFIYFTRENNSNFIKNTKNIIAQSKQKIFLTKQDNNIYFLTSNLEQTPILHTISKDKISSQTIDLLNGRVFKLNNKFYSNSSYFVDVSDFKSGLFDANHIVLQNSIGKNIFAIKDQHQLYIKVGKFNQNQLFYDDKFISNINSSAILDQNNNIYYFKQIKNKRVLYKNQKPLLEFDGYYSKVADIDGNTIYFIANTQYGSGLYCLEDGIVYRVSKYDNIIDMKILNHKYYIESITKDGYQVAIIDNNKYPSGIAKYKVLHYDKQLFSNKIKPIKGRKYNELTNLKYSSLYPLYSYDSENGSFINLNAIFTDALSFNQFNLIYLKDYDDRYYGFKYLNERYFPISFSYLKSKKAIVTDKTRRYFADIKIDIPFKKGNHQLKGIVHKYFDTDNKNKEPLIYGIKYNYKLRYPLAFGDKKSFQLAIYQKNDRKDIINYAEAIPSFGIFKRTYLGFDFKYIKKDNNILGDSRGIKTVTNEYELLEDETNILIQSLKSDYYIDKIYKYSINISQGFNYKKYFTVFPISIHKEKIGFLKNRFEIDNIIINENQYILTLDTLFFHKLNLPVELKYITNDYNNNDKFIFSIKAEF